MSNDRDIAAAFNEGIEPVIDETPPEPEWESLQFESLTPSDGRGRWWVAGIAAAMVLVVGAGSLLVLGQLSGDDDAGGDIPAVTTGVGSIEGLWVLESWEDGGERVMVEVGENTVDQPWLEFTADMYNGWTGCNSIRPAAYEYSAGFLSLSETMIQAVGCEPANAEDVLVAMLWNTADGIEVVMGDDRMEWYGSNLDGRTYPLVFRRAEARIAEPEPAPEGTPSTTMAPEQGIAVRTYDVAGIEVVIPSLLPALPERATLVEFHTTVIDPGSGPELCLGGVEDSLPPQCGGPVALSLDMDGWSEEAQGVRWGDRSVLVTWPPVDGAVEVISQAEYDPPQIVYPPGELPAACVGADLRAGVEAIHTYRESLGPADGDVYLSNDGTLVLQVVGDPEPHREALAEMGGACVVGVAYSSAEQRALQQAIHPLLRDALESIGPYASSTGPGGRVDVYLPVVDRETALLIAGLVDDPAAIRLIGSGVLQG
ncbi:MAG: hypothetical protein QNJ81_06300 [Acidimicrobiia bacterium]|nr:hypothetical protein [Acidimicrobiia bacterium]